METQKLLDEIDKLRNELILEQQKKSSLNNEDVQVKEKLYQETKSRANKAEQEVEAQKVRLLVRAGWEYTDDFVHRSLLSIVGH